MVSCDHVNDDFVVISIALKTAQFTRLEYTTKICIAMSFISTCETNKLQILFFYSPLCIAITYTLKHSIIKNIIILRIQITDDKSKCKISLNI